MADARRRPGRGHLARPRLPLVLVADDGRHPIDLPSGFEAGILLRDTDLGAVVARSAEELVPLAVDIDTIRGLNTDDAAVDFLVDRLAIEIILTRRPATALYAAERGGLALLHVLAFDSTGLGRSLEAHPRIEGVGTVVSPGLVLNHMLPAELERLPRPILGYGLITEPDDALACLRLAAAIVLRPTPAAALAALAGPVSLMFANSLTTVAAQE
jgi:glycerol-3-phosphate responsive antiterminator